jgi:hypothetical protein
MSHKLVRYTAQEVSQRLTAARVLADMEDEICRNADAGIDKSDFRVTTFDGDILVYRGVLLRLIEARLHNAGFLTQRWNVDDLDNPNVHHIELRVFVPE